MKKAWVRCFVSCLMIFALVASMFYMPVAPVALALQSSDFIYEVSNGKATIIEYTGLSAMLTIPSKLGGYPVTCIGSNSFSGSEVGTLTIPASVETIYADAFRLSMLWNISVDEKNTKYKSKNGVLYNKAGNTLLLFPPARYGSFSIDNNVTTIGDYAFTSSTLDSIIIPDNVVSIGKNAFDNCYNLYSIKLPNGITEIKDGTFTDCYDLKVINIPDSVTKIRDNAFFGCNFDEIKLPKNLKTIGSYVFTNNFSIKEITIPKNVTSIGEDNFTACDNLEKINVEAGNSKYKSINGVLFNKNGTQLLNCPAAKKGEYSIPSSVVSIETGAFSTCRELTGIKIPNGVKTIGVYAFYGCKKITEITIPNSVTSIDDYAFDDCIKLKKATVPKSVTKIGSVIFRGNPNVFIYCYADSKIHKYADENDYKFKIIYEDDVVIPAVGGNVNNKTQVTGKTVDYVFQRGAISSYLGKDTDIVIPAEIDGDTVEVLSEKLFSEQSNIKSVNIPAGVEVIEWFAFFSCYDLTAINVDKNNKNYKSIDGVLFSKDGTVLIQYPAAKKGDYTIPGSVTVIGEGAFCAAENLKNVRIPNTVERIDDRAFERSGLVDVIIPSKVNEISISAFADCINLRSVTMSDNVTSIYKYAFTGCAFSEIKLPDKLRFIGDSAFSKCDRLTELVIPSGVNSIGWQAFSECPVLGKINVSKDNADFKSIDGVLFSKDTTVLLQYPVGRQGEYTIPKGTAEIASKAFMRCENLTSIKIPNSLEYIASNAFQYCNKLEVVKLPNGLKIIDVWAFSDCASLKRVDIPPSVISIEREVFKNSPVTIYCKYGSYAEKYAAEHSITYYAKMDYINFSLIIAAVVGAGFGVAATVVFISLRRKKRLKPIGIDGVVSDGSDDDITHEN